MGIFSKKYWTEVSKYYLVNGNLWRIRMFGYLSDKESKLSEIELLKKHDVYACEYDFYYDTFAEWDEKCYDSIDQALYNIPNIKEVNVEDLEEVIKDIKEDFKKKFVDFELDGKLYTHKEDNCKYFAEIIRPITKLINNKKSNIGQSLLLEVEVLDDSSTEIKRKFIPFYTFLKEYNLGCNLKIVQHINTSNSFIDSFDFINYSDK